MRPSASLTITCFGIFPLQSPTWIVDPLDGTVNFTHLFPLVCVSIGFTYKKLPLIGAIYAPLLSGLDPHFSGGTLWSAAQGRGAYQSNPHPEQPETSSLRWLEAHAPALPGSSTIPSPPPEGLAAPLRLPLAPLRPLSASAPSGLLFASEWGKDRRDTPGSNLSRKVTAFWNLACVRGGRGGKGGQAHGIRSLGSAALDLAWCAAGSVDVFLEGGCWEWVSGPKRQDATTSLLNANIGCAHSLSIRPRPSLVSRTSAQA